MAPPQARPSGPALPAAAILIATCLALLASGCWVRADAPPSIEHEGSLNLGAILRHQEALEAECASYHHKALKEFQQQHQAMGTEHGEILAKRLAVQVPAVCLFLFSRFRKSEPWNELSHQGKLDFVNWIYNEELMKFHQQPSADNYSEPAKKNKKKQQQHQTPGWTGKLAAALQADTGHNEPPASSANKNADAALNALNDDSDELQVRAQANELDSVMAMDQFQQVISRNKPKLVSRLSPVVLVPGLLGSRLQGKYDKGHRVNILCSKQGDWKDLWLSLKNLLPILVDCWVDNVRLELDPETGYTREPEGVLSRVPDFGSVESVRYLDKSHPKLTSYFAELIEAYEQLGYTPDLNLLAAPYDFRLAPQQLASTYYADLRRLIEGAQSVAGGKKVTLVCHSLGCTHLLVFLRQQGPAWRQASIRKLVALASPWGGSAKALKALVVGDRLDLPAVSEAKMRQIARNYPSIGFLLPQPEVFSPPARRNSTGAGSGPVLVETPKRSYRAEDMEDLLHDLGLGHQAKWYRETSALIKPLEPLADLQVDCIHSVNVSTPETLLFEDQADFPDRDYELLLGPGDGTVNLASLMVCKRWAQMLPNKVIHKTVHNTNHVGLLKHHALMSYVRDDVLASD